MYMGKYVAFSSFFFSSLFKGKESRETGNLFFYSFID